MNVIQNLIQGEFIRKGTWVGVRNSHKPITQRLVVERWLPDGDLIVRDMQNHQLFRMPPQLVAEIDGMTLDRFLEQADLDPQGIRKQNLVRRGRKPKVRT